MSFLRTFSSKICQIARSNLIQSPVNRALSVSVVHRCKEADANEENQGDSSVKNNKPNQTTKLNIDRTRIIPVETSIRYLKSEAYQTTYGDQPVWVQYRRNHKGQIPPRKTRKTCIRQGKISTGSPCPICRDEYLVLDPRNTGLLQQFISEHTDQVLSYQRTGLCQKRHQQLIVAIEQARDLGLLTFDVPFREYEYSEYYGKDWYKAQRS